MRLDADKEPRSGLDFANPDPPGEPGRTEPTLCVLPRGNYYGGRSGMGYDFPALITPEALRQLIDFALARFAARIGAAQVAMRRLLLTAHSGGGGPPKGRSDPASSSSRQPKRCGMSLCTTRVASTRKRRARGSALPNSKPASARATLSLWAAVPVPAM